MQQLRSFSNDIFNMKCKLRDCFGVFFERLVNRRKKSAFEAHMKAVYCDSPDFVAFTAETEFLVRVQRSTFPIVQHICMSTYAVFCVAKYYGRARDYFKSYIQVILTYISPTRYSVFILPSCARENMHSVHEHAFSQRQQRLLIICKSEAMEGTSRGGGRDANERGKGISYIL